MFIIATFKLFGVPITTEIISNQQSACLRSWYYRLGGTSLYDGLWEHH